MSATIFVLLPDFGSEGLGEPTAAFAYRAEADAAKALMDKSGYANTRLVEVPVWPNLPRKDR